MGLSISAKVAGLSSDTSPPRNLMSVSPHPRMLIEAVSGEEAIAFQEELRRDRVMNPLKSTTPLSEESMFPQLVGFTTKYGEDQIKMFLDVLTSEERAQILVKTVEVADVWYRSIGEEQAAILASISHQMESYESNAKTFEKGGHLVSSKSVGNVNPVLDHANLGGGVTSFGSDTDAAIYPESRVENSETYVLDDWESSTKFHSEAATLCRGIISDISQGIEIFTGIIWQSVDGQLRDTIGDKKLNLDQSSVVNLIFDSPIHGEYIERLMPMPQSVPRGGRLLADMDRRDNRPQRSPPKLVDDLVVSDKPLAQGEEEEVASSIVKVEDPMNARTVGPRNLLSHMIRSPDTIGSSPSGPTEYSSPDSLERLLFKFDHIKKFRQRIVEYKHELVAAHTAGSALPAESTMIDNNRLSQRLAHLVSEVSRLSSMKLGIEDSLTIFKELKSAYTKQVNQMITKAQTKLSSINRYLKKFETIVAGVYIDAQAFISDKIVPDSLHNNHSGFTAALEYLRSVSSKKHHESLPSRAGYTLLVMQELHAHIYSLVEGMSFRDQVPDEIQSNLLQWHLSEEPRLAIQDGGPVKETPKVKVDVAATEPSLTPVERSETTRVDVVDATDVSHVEPPMPTPSEMIEPIQVQRARVTAECILYGRVDGFQIFAENTRQDSVCEKPMQFGMKHIRELVAEGAKKQTEAIKAPPTQENGSLSKAGTYPSIQEID